MKYDLIICGVGGQGIISIAAVLGRAAIATGLSLKQSEIHGMAQRGGSVYSHLRMADSPVRSDMIPLRDAEMILSVEPMEALRYLPWLSPEGWLVSNEVPFPNIPNYPELEDLKAEILKVKNHLLFNADQLAKDEGSPRSMNMAMLGAASAHINAITPKVFEEAIQERFEAKGERIVEVNLKVFRAARALAEGMAVA